MGAFFANVHVRRVGDDDLEALRSLLEVDARSEGMRPLAPGETPDRSVVLVRGDRWWSIYDQAADPQDETVLGRVAGAASSALGAPAFFALVHDSDVLRLGLFEGGEQRDLYDSNPGYFTGRGKRGPPGPHVERWKGLLAPGRAEADLERVFGSDDLFAEGALRDLARAVGASPDRLGTGYRYLSEQPLPAGAVTLAWRLEARPAYETTASGAPLLETQWEQAKRLFGTEAPPEAFPPVQAGVEGDVRLGLTTYNAGGGGRGVRITIQGGGPFVEWEKVQLILGDPRQRGVLEATPEAEGDLLVARFPDADVPAGLAGGGYTSDPHNLLKAMEARFATQVHANVGGKGVAPGTTEAVVGLVPEGGEGTSQRFRLVVRSTENRPLRAPPGLHPLALAPLEATTHLALLAVLEPEGAVDRARAVVAALAPFAPASGKVRTTRFPAPGKGLLGRFLGVMKQPKLSTGKADGFLAGKRWQALLDDARGSSGLVTAEWVADAETIDAAARVELGVGIIPPPEALPALAVGLQEGDLAAAAQALMAAMDEATRDGRVVQALLTRWGVHPSGEATPYEVACGLHGQCTLGRPWATRWLRAVGEGWLWLGPALLERVDLAALQAVAAVEPLERGVRVTVGDVRAVEEVLAPLLPTQEDWQQAMMARYRR